MVFGIELGDPGLAHRAFEYARQNGQFFHRPAFWMRLEGGRLFRRDPRLAATMEEWGLDEYWREFGWPSGGMCAPLGEGFVRDN